jgi:CMP-N-acetylneuraminic acid synthetase
LAGDDIPTSEVVLHAVDWLREKGQQGEYLVLMEPTAPLRRSRDIETAVRLLEETEADSVVSVSELPHTFHPDEVLAIRDGLLQPFSGEGDMNTRNLRAGQQPAYIPNGVVYAVKTAALLEHRLLYGHSTAPLVMPWSSFLDIDTETDLELAHFRMQKGRAE